MAHYDFTKLFDFTALMEIQKKNIEALTKANDLAFEGFQAAGQRQAQMFSQIVGETSSIVKQITEETTPQKIAMRQAELVKKACEKSVTDWREIADIIGESGKEATGIIHARVNSSLTELKSALNKNDKVSVHKKAA